MARTWIAVAAIGVTLALPGWSAADDVPVYGTSTVVGQVPGGTCCVSQIAVADFNGDGLQDAIFTRSVYLGSETFPVTVLLNDGQGKFVDATSSVFVGPPPVTQNARELVVADFNADGRPDVFVADHGDDRDPFPGFQNTLILSAPGGRLVDATANLPQASDFTHSATAADVNGGGTDIYAGNIYGGNAVPPGVLLNDGSAVFSVAGGLLPPAQTDLAQNKYTSSLFADVNGDGKSDLILGGEDHTASSVVLLNDGTGHFTVLAGALPAKPFGPDAIALDIAALDANHDPHPDLLIAFTKGNPFYVGRWIQVLVNNGDGTFDDETSTRLPQSDNSDGWPVFIELRDLNRDGRMDFGVQVAGGGSSPLFIADEAGAFHPGPLVNAGGPVWTFIDALGDGSNDILSVNSGSGAVSLFPEHPTSAPPPAGAAPDTTRPRLSVAVRRAHKLRRVLRNGLRVTVGCSEACRLSVRLVLVSRRGLRTARVITVGRASGRLAAAGRKKITVKLTRRARASFRGKRKVTLTLRITATDTAHNTSRASRRIVLKR
jgi:hypothetical protein